MKSNTEDAKNWDDFQVVNLKSNFSTIDSYNCYLTLIEKVKELPMAELIKRGWVKSDKDITQFSTLFQYICSDTGHALFRKSNTADNTLCAFWLSRVVAISKAKVVTEAIPSFKKFSKNDMKSLAKLSINENVILEIPNILKEIGIVVVYERSLPGMKLDGAVFLLPSGHPVISLSLRHARLDNYWFTLMHELSHIYLHLDKLETPILENLYESSKNTLEKEADRLAKYSFVDQVEWRNCDPKYNKNNDSVIRFAEKVGVHKSIIAGLLRNEENNYNIYNDLINEVNTRRIIYGQD